MFGLGAWELALIFGVVVLIFGARRLPQIGRGLGEGIRNFKRGIKDTDGDADQLTDGGDQQP